MTPEQELAELKKRLALVRKNMAENLKWVTERRLKWVTESRESAEVSMSCFYQGAEIYLEEALVNFDASFGKA